ncbi:TetR/AcrR family transcriptional regulator [Corynebacterium striatum]|uniref:TetR/AcrR family transcriptional regulator n=2 Tax=Corynebacterium TaxID=1716 RepID=A0AAQ1TUU5_CORST|nr:TetR/AcrR family transcriptional regulator [Corynebacterium striatum]ATZ05735.1 TetR/AcrR family transcriptional regulator [Corynebacterium striatum]EEI79314.1 transcriptional regulator, TetR family [Corynebacterium striatum ATCC 6940]EGT5576318.1 TetR/AcrR family transcriptional regulator [Corynebacterium striatum]EGT5592484.1 TetR/AcrR family transcriptional regulator [Corynebacterium striatum]EGT5595304.1 TetR/AcrR family transcriptional regulator [Corynebacterium striatum]
MDTGPAQEPNEVKPSARERILECSRVLFSEHTFAQVSLKDIAEAAGVSVALVVKHFGNKDSLFEATVDFTASSAALFAGPFGELGRTAVIETLTAPHNAPYSMARTISVAAGAPESLNAIGKRIKSDLLQVLAQRIRDEAPHPSPSPELRAQSAVALLMGLSFMRRFGDTEFEAFHTDTLIEYYAPVLQEMLDGHSPERCTHRRA